MGKIIPFSKPDITDLEINNVVDTLKSGWITTGPKTKLFEKEISLYCGTEKTVCVNSATAGLELVLRLFDIGQGDEVITTPYTYAATANVIFHTGAKIVFADVEKDSFNISPAEIAKKITKKTKAVIVVDFGGFPCDYKVIKDVLEQNKTRYKPVKNTLQTSIDKPLLLIDAAHSFGSSYFGKKTGNHGDFTVFSFHAVKNLTTAEGGAITYNSFGGIDTADIYKKLMLLSLHGQNKDALEKFQKGGWRYNIEIPGYKCNMTDIAASLGLSQLSRYDSDIMFKMNNLFELYKNNFTEDCFLNPPFYDTNKTCNSHLFPLRLNKIKEDERDKIIIKLDDAGIKSNVHFIPVPMHPAYKKIGYDIKNYPETFNMYQNEISLPIYSLLNKEDALYVVNSLKKIIL